MSTAFNGVIAPNPEKAEKILTVLRKYRNSPVWLRKIAKESKLPPSTVKRYLEKYLNSFVSMSRSKTPVDMEFVMVRLVNDPKHLED